MDGYYGTDDQKRLQRKSDSSVDWWKTTRGAVISGRFLGTDDPEALGWSVIFETLENDGAFTFRMVLVEKIESIQNKLAERGFRLDLWNVFSGDRETVAASTTEVLEAGLPDGYSLLFGDELSDPSTLNDVQDCMARNGVVPCSRHYLGGSVAPSALVAIRHRENTIVATAFGVSQYNAMSVYHTTAWCGLVAVDEDHRRHRLGGIVNAAMLQHCLKDLGAEHVQEFAAETNIPSRRMIESCGLSLDRSVMSGIATSGEGRFTR